jgi:hypothetical protein
VAYETRAPDRATSGNHGQDRFLGSVRRGEIWSWVGVSGQSVLGKKIARIATALDVFAPSFYDARQAEVLWCPPLSSHCGGSAEK